MTRPDRLDPDEWRIEDQPRGWILRYRPPLTRVLRRLPSAYGRVPAVLASSNGLWICFFAAYAALWGIELYLRKTTYLQNAIGALVGLCFELIRKYLFTDMALNAEQRVVAENGHVKTFGGVFSEACLRSLRLAPSQQRDKRWRLVFSGANVREAVLVGEPGLSEGAAQQLFRAVLARVGQQSADVAPLNCEPRDAMDSRALSGSIASPAAASPP